MMEFFWDRNTSDSDNPKPPPDYNKHLHNIEFPSHAIDDLDELINNSSASFTQIPMSIIIERVEKGDILLQDLIRIFHNRIDLEEKDIYYSKQFSKAVLSENEIPMSSTAEALSSFQNYYHELSNEQTKIRYKYQQNLQQDLTNYHSIYSHIVMKHRGDIEKSLQQITHTSTQLIKMKQHLIKLIDESQREEEKLLLSKKNLEFLIQQQHENLTAGVTSTVASTSGIGSAVGEITSGSSSSSPSERGVLRHGQGKEHPSSSLLYDRLFSVFDIPVSPEQEIEKQVSRVDKLEKEKEKKRKEMEDKKTQLLFALEERDRIWSAAMKAFETAEQSRLHHSERALKQFCQYERELLETKLNLLNRLERDVVNKINTSEDLKKFSERETDVDHTHLYSHALKVMEWDYRKTFGTPPEDSDWEGSGVWIDSEGIPSEESLFQSHSSPSRDDSLAEVECEEIERVGLLDLELPRDGLVEDPITRLSVSKKSHDNEDFPPNESLHSHSQPQPQPLSKSTSSISSTPSPITAATMMNVATAAAASVTSVQELLDHYLFPSLATPHASSSSSASSSSTKKMTILDQPLFIEFCRRCFAEKDGRELFLQALDDRRGRNSELLKEQYERMKIAMKVFLDQCQESRDVKSALRIANMSITFHTRALPPHPSSSCSASPERAVPVPAAADCCKHYLQQEAEIAHNLIWKSDQFWEDSLVVGLSEQLEMMERVRWDELEADVLREKIIAVHNIVFGQLGTIAFTMHEMGLPQKLVERFVMSRAHGAQLGRDQQVDLLKSIRATYLRNASETTLPTAAAHSHTVSRDRTIGAAAIESNDDISDDESKHSSGRHSRHGKLTPNIAQIRDSL